MATMGLLNLSLVAYKSPILFRNGRTTFIIKKTYPKARTTVYMALPKEPAFTIAITTAKIHHAVISSAAAQVITIVPSFVL
ncbi:hypothetical protein D3C80_1510180 [compost metagenome]